MEMQTQGWQRALVISEGYWLTAGRYQSWQDGGARRIWMKQQQNGFASPSLSSPLRTTEWEWLRKYVSAYSRRHCIIYTGEHKQSWTNCLKHKMWFFCIHSSICLHRNNTLFLFSVAASLPLFSSITVSGKVILHSDFKTSSSFHPISGWAGQKIRGASVKSLMWRKSCVSIDFEKRE